MAFSIMLQRPSGVSVHFGVRVSCGGLHLFEEWHSWEVSTQVCIGEHLASTNVAEYVCQLHRNALVSWHARSTRLSQVLAVR